MTWQLRKNATVLTTFISFFIVLLPLIVVAVLLYILGGMIQ